MHNKILVLLVGLGFLASAVGFGLSQKVASAQSAPPAVTQTAPAGAVSTPKDKPSQESVASEKNEPEAEKKEAKEADENLPGGGHADPDGANINHEFDGIE